MSGKKKILMVLLCLLILTAVGLGVLWHTQHYEMIDFRLYPKGATVLDLRGQEISLSHYHKIRRRMPECEIYWDVPLQGNVYSQDTTALTLTDLTEEEAQALAYFPRLETLDARGCENYDLLRMVQRTYPDLQVLYTVTISGREYAQDAQVLYVDGIQAEELVLLEYLPELAQVRLESGKNADQLEVLTELCRQRDIPVQVMLGGVGYDVHTTGIELEGVTEEMLQLLYFLPDLKQVTFTDPKADAASLRQLVQDRPGANIQWTSTVMGVTITNDTRQLDLTAELSQAGALAYEKAKTAPVQGTRDEIPYLFAVNDKYPLEDKTASTARLIEEVEQALRYYPNVQEVILCGAILDNEAMAAFREAHREDYKVVWTVQCGNKMIARTDTPYFMPTKFHVYYFLDEDAVNLKYCEEIVALDLGHMAVSNVDWVTYMPKLEYLVLAHTQLKYIEPLSTCKNLKFLELDWSPIRDYTPLKECTALEDLNLGETFADFTPVESMTWLKNLWMVGCSQGARNRVPQSLTGTRVMVSGDATVANGWRELPNYYAMRDALGMHYMSW